ncbi:MAG: polysaccharide biosynthesis/export family protein [Hyphomicrobiaceae bacterium]
MGISSASDVPLDSNEAPVKAKEAPATAGIDVDPALAVKSRLIYAATINIRIPGNRVLSGEYRVSADGTISMPVIGRLDVSKLSAAEFEQQLKGEIYRVSNRETNVAIEVEQYRSVFVSGVVTRAGAFPWRPGLSVLHAEALAGGIARTPAQGAQPANPLLMLRETERNNRAAYDLAASLATIERLRTEKRGASLYITPARVAELVSAKELERLASAQQATLNSRKADFDVRVRALQNTKTMAASEKNALEMQRVRINEQLVGRKALRERVRRMTEQGYSRADRVFEEQIRVAQLEERLTTTSLGISRMAMAVATAQQDLESLVSGRQAEIDLELLNLEQRVSQLEIQLKNTQNRDERADEQGGPMVLGSELRSPTYEIVRVISGRSIVLKADRTSALLPGDVLVVGRANY